MRSVLLLFLIVQICMAVELPDVYISDIKVDGSANEIWVGTYKGVYMFRNQSLFREFRGPEFEADENNLTETAGDLSSRFVTSLLIDTRFCYAGTDRSLDIISRGTYKVVSRTPMSQVTSFIRLGKKYVLMSTLKGVFYVDESMKPAPVSGLKQALSFLDNEPVHRLHFHKDGKDIWVALSRGGVVRIGRSGVTHYLNNVRIKDISSFESNVCFMAEDSLLTYNGFSWQRKRPKPFGNLPSKHLYRIYGFRDGLLLSCDNGTYLYDTAFFTQLFEEGDEINRMHVMSFSYDGENLYLGSRKQGVFCRKL